MTLNDIKAGDEVLYQGRVAFESCTKLVKVDRTTRDHIVIGDERFNRDSGYLRGASSHHTQISVPTEEEREGVLLAMKRRRAGERLQRLTRSLERLSEPTLDKIIAVHKVHLEAELAAQLEVEIRNPTV